MICTGCGKKKKCKPYFLRGYNYMFCSKTCLADYVKAHPTMTLYGNEVLQFNMEM
jgi:hypothetical protein